MIRNNQSDYAVRRATSQNLKSEPFVRGISQRVAQEDNVVKSFKTQPKCYVGKAMD